MAGNRCGRDAEVCLRWQRPVLPITFQRMPEPAQPVPYASPASSGSSLWKLFRLGLILWACVTLARHAFYWTNALGNGGYSIGPLAMACIECVLLILILLAALNSPRGTRNRFQVLGGLGGAFVAIVVIGALIDIFANDPFSIATPSAFLRVVWMFISRVQVAVFPLLCLIGLIQGVADE